MIAQIAAVTLINLRSIPQRWGMSLATIFSIAIVVMVLLWFLSMANGFRATIQGSGSDDIAIMLRAGSQAELNSGFGRDTVRLIETAPGIARTEDDRPLLSSELYVIVDGRRRSSGTDANMPLRGVGAEAASLRDNFTLVEGRMFAEGSNELVVGAGVVREYEGFDLGQTIRLGLNDWTVVGLFSTDGSVFDSEIWADIGVIQNLYQRNNTFQSIRVRLDSADAIEALRTYVEEEPRLDLDVSNEREYFAQSAGGTQDLILFVGWPLAIIMAVGAFAGAWNAMYASVDSRLREIATLRAIGFAGFPAFVGTLVESVLLALNGGVIGAVVTYFVFNGLTASTLGSSFTQVVFSFTVTSGSIVSGMILALIVGLLGGFVPAIRAARAPLLAVHG